MHSGLEQDRYDLEAWVAPHGEVRIVKDISDDERMNTLEQQGYKRIHTDGIPTPIGMHKDDYFTATETFRCSFTAMAHQLLDAESVLK